MGVCESAIVGWLPIKLSSAMALNFFHINALPNLPLLSGQDKSNEFILEQQS